MVFLFFSRQDLNFILSLPQMPKSFFVISFIHSILGNLLLIGYGIIGYESYRNITWLYREEIRFGSGVALFSKIKSKNLEILFWESRKDRINKAYLYVSNKSSHNCGFNSSDNIPVLILQDNVRPGYNKFPAQVLLADSGGQIKQQLF